MLEQTLKQLMHALSDEEAGALLDGFSVPQAIQARIAENVTVRMEADLAAHAAPKRRAAVPMQWVYSAAACVAVILAAVAFRYFGHVTPVAPTYPDESGISQTEQATTAYYAGTTTAVTAMTTTSPPDTQSSMTETMTGSIGTTTTVTYPTEPVYTVTFDETAPGTDSASQSPATAQSTSHTAATESVSTRSRTTATTTSTWFTATRSTTSTTVTSTWFTATHSTTTTASVQFTSTRSTTPMVTTSTHYTDSTYPMTTVIDSESTTEGTTITTVIGILE